MSDVATATKPAGALAIEIAGMHKWYGEFHVLRDINLAVERRERIVICGPSGSGKSTMIRCINRLEEHQQGRIVVAGIELTSDLKNIEAIRREVGMVFQQFNLFPHLTVLDNVTLAPIWVRKMPRAKAEALAMQLLERVRIGAQAALGWRAAGVCHRGLARHDPAHHAVRRADLRPRPRDGEGGAGGHDRA